MKVSPNRGRVKRKWAVGKTYGPVILIAELLQKKLIQHSWPCEYGAQNTGSYEEGFVTFSATKSKQSLGPDFISALDVAIRIVAAENKCEIERSGLQIRLIGQYHVNKYGKVRPGNPPLF